MPGISAHVLRFKADHAIMICVTQSCTHCMQIYDWKTTNMWTSKRQRHRTTLQPLPTSTNAQQMHPAIAQVARLAQVQICSLKRMAQFLSSFLSWPADHPGCFFVVLLDYKQDEAHEPECRHVCWRTETILIYNIYLSHFPANPLLGHPDVTHWGDTLVRHPSYLTLLLYTVVRHFYLTLL